MVYITIMSFQFKLLAGGERIREIGMQREKKKDMTPELHVRKSIRLATLQKLILPGFSIFSSALLLHFPFSTVLISLALYISTLISIQKV